MLLKPGLRKRIALGLVGFSIATSIAFGIGAYWAADTMEVLVLEQNIGERAQRAARAIAAGEAAQLPEQDWYYARFQSEPEIARDFGYLQSGSHHDVLVDGVEFHVWIEPVPNDRLFLFYDLTQIEVYEGQLEVFLYSIGALLSVLSFVLGYMVTPWIAKPVSVLARRVSDLPHDAQGLEAEQTDDPDLVVLAEAINTYLQSRYQLIERERSFTGMASHEMRTPVAIISAALDVIKLSPEARKLGDPLDRIQRATNRMSSLIEVLLEFARGEKLTLRENESFQAAACVREIIAEQVAQGEPNNSTFELNLDDEQSLDCKPVIFRVLAGNLIANALKHSTGDEIKVRLNKAEFSVQSEGEMIMKAERGGLGLEIVEVICSRLGWTFDCSTADGVTTATVRGI